MLYKSELQKCLATIRRAGADKKCTVITPTAVDSFSGESGTPLTMDLYFAQVNYDNSELELNPNLVEGVKIIVCPLKDDGTVEANFLAQCRDKATTVLLPTGKTMSVKFARITSPDSVTPIVARLSLGG